MVDCEVMAKPDDHGERLRYGPISLRSQSTQTLPGQTQPPTQLLSHEAHQYTQLVHHDSAEHLHGDTLVNDSDCEGSGDTVVLNDDDGHAHAVANWGPNSKGFSINRVEQERIQRIQKELPDSDATTEEGDGGDIECDDADGESRLLHTNVPSNEKGIAINDNSLTFERSSLPEGEAGSPKFALADNVKEGSAAVANDVKESQSKPKSISSVRAASLRASGLRAAGRSASLNSVGKNPQKFDSESMVDLNQGKLNDELNKSQEGFKAELHGQQCAERAFPTELDPMQSSPKVTVPFDNALACMSTSRSISKGVSLIDDVRSEEAMKSCVHSDEMPIAGMPVSGSHRAENTLATLRPLQQLQPHIGSNVVGDDQSVQTGHSNSQKARKLVFDSVETKPTDRLAGEGRTMSRLMNGDYNGVISKQTSGIQTPARQGSVPGATSTSLSYLESHDPGEESQMNALNVIDKLVWLDTSSTPDNTVTNPEPEDSSMRFHTGSKGRQSLAQAAQMKAVHDKLDVFDWEDSQVDKDSNPNEKSAAANVGGHKQKADAQKLPISGKKQGKLGQQKTTAAPTHSPNVDQKSSLDMITTPSPGVESLFNSRTQEAEIEPHIVLTTRLRSRTKDDSLLSSKASQRPGLQRGHGKSSRSKKNRNELTESLKTGQQSDGENTKGKVQNFGFQPRKRAVRKKPIDESSRDLKAESKNLKLQRNKDRQIIPSRDLKVRQQPEKASEEGKQEIGETCKDGNTSQAVSMPVDRTSDDDAAADIWIEAFSTDKNKRPSDKNSELIKFRKRSALPDDSGRDLKKLRTSQLSSDERDKGHLLISESTETSADHDRVRLGTKSDNSTKKSKNDNTEISALPVNRVVKTRLRKRSQDNLDVSLSLGKELANEAAVTSQPPKKSKVSHGQLKTIHGEHPDGVVQVLNALEKCATNRDHVAEHAPKHSLMEDLGKGGSDGREPASLSIAQQVGRAIKPSGRPKTRSGASHKYDFPSSSEGKEDDFGTKTLNRESNELPKKKLLMRDKLEAATVNLKDEACKVLSVEGSMKSQAADGTLIRSNIAAEDMRAKDLKRRKGAKNARYELVCESGKPKDDESAHGLERIKKGKQAADAISPDLQHGMEDSISREDEKLSKVVLRTEVSKSSDHDLLRPSRRTRSNTGSDCPGRRESKKTVKENFRITKIEELTPEDKKAKASLRSGKLSPQQRKVMKALGALDECRTSPAVDEGKRKKRDSSEIRVLFSHSLTEDAIKHQKKILAKLGGHLATSALECTHFISSSFVRSQNMLISMAAGKIVATTLWLESCGQAHYFVDEKNYILHDDKKEKELGFSMVTSLAAARRKSLFKDMKVIICPSTVPEPTALKAIVESAGGQVMDARTSSPQSDIDDDEKSFIVIANEKGVDCCRQFLVKGLTVYSEELVLQGVVAQNLDFTRNRLFEDFSQQKSLRRRV